MLVFGWLMLGGAAVTASIVIPRWRIWTIPMILTFGSVPVVTAILIYRNR
jgi:hypothetical protein